MSRYTVRGSAALDARIDVDLRRIAEAAAPHSLAGILLGGYGRGEGTPFIHSDGSQAPFNDYDLVVVVDRLTGTVRQKFRTLEQQLSAEVGLPVDLCPYRRDALPKCEFSLLNYEMKHGHRVVWGDANALATLPDYPHAAIPLSEGARLLMNRGKLLLDIRLRLARSEPLSEEERLRFLKFLFKVRLALGDCALLAARKYDILYSVKKERISAAGSIPDRDCVIDGYRQAIELKQWGDFQPCKTLDIAAEFRTVRDLYLRFFAWYGAQGLGNECSRLKAMFLNLQWNGRPSAAHPRRRMYAAIQELLKDTPDDARLSRLLFCRDGFSDTFYRLQRRFS